MKTRSRAGLMMAMIVAALALSACQTTEGAGSRPGQSRGPYGGIEGGASF